MVKICNVDWNQKVELMALEMVENFDAICIRLDTMPQCDRQVDGRTDGRKCHISIAVYTLAHADAR